MKPSYINRLLALSAVSYSLAFIIPSAWWAVFIAFTLLFYCSLRSHLSFKEGFAWGSLFFGIQESGIIYSLFTLSQGSFSTLLMLLLLIAALIIYQAVCAGIWFLSAHAISHVYKKPWFTLTTWVLTSWLFTLFIDHALLAPFGTLEGYPLAHPLLPLAYYPPALTLLPLIGKQLLTGIFLTTTACIALASSIRTRVKQILLVVLAIVPWFISTLFYSANTNAPVCLSTIAVLPESFYNPQSPEKTIKEVAQKLRAGAKLDPEVQLIILPESALYLCDLLFYKDLLHEWDTAHIGRPLHILTGALYTENGNSFNTVYWVYNGIIKQYFCKKHALFPTERLPKSMYNSVLQELYYSQRPVITPSCNKRIPFTISHTLEFVPYICSEIFFMHQPNDTYNQIPIVSLCNDTWIAVPYVEQLMQLMHRFRAIEWQRDILYVPYAHSYLYDTTGQQWAIKSI